MIHTKCRNTDLPYLKSNVYRVYVPESRIPWEIEFGEYNPIDYTSELLNGKPWADPQNPKSIQFNEIDGKINRKSHFSVYGLDIDGRPINPIGRTGLRGRGVLGRWGPNHAADPIVSRVYHGELQFVGIKRGDNGEWAIPGGMVDPGENITDTLRREFTEEVLGNVQNHKIEELWKKGQELFKGYVDDPRNTDNAWMETVVYNFHDDQGLFDSIELKAGDDASDVNWITVNSNMPLYASHENFIKILKDLHSK